MDIHQVVNDAALNVSFVTMHQHFGSWNKSMRHIHNTNKQRNRRVRGLPLGRMKRTGVEDFHETEMALEYLIERLVLSLVVLDAQQKVVEHRIVLRVLVIGAVDLHLLDCGLHDFRIVADGLDK